MQVDSILKKLIPAEIQDFITGLVERKQKDDFESTPSDLQMIVIILKGGSVPEVRPGPIMDRYQKPPLPRNSFQI